MGKKVKTHLLTVGALIVLAIFVALNFMLDFYPAALLLAGGGFALVYALVYSLIDDHLRSKRR